MKIKAVKEGKINYFTERAWELLPKSKDGWIEIKKHEKIKLFESEIREERVPIRNESGRVDESQSNEVLPKATERKPRKPRTTKSNKNKKPTGQ
jgi:hypothetical protein